MSPPLRRRLAKRRQRAVWAYQTRRLASTRLLRSVAANLPEATFVQVGSNDGEQLDPLREHILRERWRGVMVEPVPHAYARLEQNYQHLADRVVLENVAIADRAGDLPFHHLAPVDDYRAEGLPQWYDALGSFRREVVLKHIEYIPDIEDRLVTTLVPCITFTELCERNGIEHLDLLHIDTEGYDFEILKTIDWARHRPLMVIYEHLHLDVDVRAACLRMLADLGYGAIEENMDTWCVDLDATGRRPAAVVDRFRRLRDTATRR